MATFLTGATGYLGSYVAAGLLREGETVNALVRSRSLREGERRLWRSLQLHLGHRELAGLLGKRLHVFAGDLTAPRMGLAPDARRRLAETTDSVIHCAASLNRRSERACLNGNVRATLAVLRLAREAHERGGVRRFSQVSTVSVAGERRHENVSEFEAVDWHRNDYDAYGRTKKLAELLVRELLEGIPYVIFRPSIVLGDSTRPETTQFDMVRAFSVLAALPALPLRATDRIDIVPTDWVTAAIVELHRKESPEHDTYHLSAGTASPTYAELADAVYPAFDRHPPAFVPALEKPTAVLTAALTRLGSKHVRRAAALLHVFLPYLTYDTVFDNSRVVQETGRVPRPAPEWCVPLLTWARHHRFAYPYAPWPGDTEATSGRAPTAAAGSLAS